MANEAADIAAAYGLTGLSPASPLAGGTLNRNYRVETRSGPVFVRLHREDALLAQVRGEHALIAWAGHRGVPVARPLTAKDGSTVVQRGERLWAVFPWIEGIPPERGRISGRVALAIGACHGLTHAVLSSHLASTNAAEVPVFEAKNAATRLRHLLVIAREQHEETLAATIEFQLQLLETHGVDSFSFGGLPHSLAHGDFHDQQVLLTAEDAIAAVVDWEMFGSRPRAFEVIRSLSFSLLLGNPLMEAYLQGYRQHSTLTREDCRTVVELWWQQRLQSSWAYGAYLLDGNARLKGFFPAMRDELDRLRDARWRSELADRMGAGG